MHEIIAPCTPQHSGATERKNRTILNMGGSRPKEKKMTSLLWGEVVATTAYVINKNPLYQEV